MIPIHIHNNNNTNWSQRMYLTIPSVCSCFPFACVFMAFYLSYSQRLTLHLVISHSLPCETMPLIWCCAKNYVTKKEKNKTERTKKLYPEQGNSSINEPFLYTLYETCMCIRYESYIVSFAFGTSLFSTKSSIFFRQYARILVYSGYTVPLVCICVLWEEIL